MQNRIFFLTHAHSDSHTVYRDFLVSFVQFIRFSEMLVQWWISFKVISKLHVFSAFSMYFLFWMILNLKQIFFFSISFIRPSFVEDLCLKENRSYYLTLAWSHLHIVCVFMEIPSFGLLRWSFFTLIYNRSSNIWIISYILHIIPSFCLFNPFGLVECLLVNFRNENCGKY